MIKEVKKMWNKFDARENQKKDDKLSYTSFYHAFMIPYFGCHACESTRSALDAIDMDDDGFIDWIEFQVYLKWALN